MLCFFYNVMDCGLHEISCNYFQQLFESSQHSYMYYAFSFFILAAYLSYLALNIREAEGEGSGTRGGGLMEEDFDYQLTCFHTSEPPMELPRQLIRLSLNSI